MSNRDFEAFQATSQAMEKVMMALKDDKAAVIGVYGRGGIGKTTLVKHVGSQAKKDKLYDQVIVVVISQSPDLRNIQGTLADLLGLNLENKSEFEFGYERAVKRAVRLKEGIMRGNRILIILDDLWKRIELSAIGIPSCYELQKCNSKVLLTTRRLNVCQHLIRRRFFKIVCEDSKKVF
ncbi:probable disease resistance protein At1g61300 [Rosa chinensis]|uniref:probable disease resistance protein At1g61300 n=1 Tax=Rosa chinensis TaxID=74649 RepID=UPI000D095C7A|nr:probable disease resistance protein At1g61300 [Rosa chinensis]